jgi:DUF917 family protein
MRTLSRIDLEDILDGACILGSGGGGPRSLGQQLMTYLASLSNPVRLADPLTDVGDDEVMAVSAAVGSPEAAAQGQFPHDVATIAFDALNQLQRPASGRDFAYVLAGEVGAGNSFIPMLVAAQKDLPLVDAAGARRAIPSLTMCTYASRRLVIAPVVLANKQRQISFSVSDAAEAEPPMRAIISDPDFGQDAGIAFWTMRGATMKTAAIPHTLTYARELGQTLRAAREGGENPVEAVRQFLDGYLLFIGRMLAPHEQTQGGFDFGTVVLQNDDKTEQVWIYNQNENLIAWSTQKASPIAMGPDLICYLTTDGQTFSNADLAGVQGKEVALIGARCTDELRDPSIVAAFQQALRNLGYAGPYVPLEELQGANE